LAKNTHSKKLKLRPEWQDIVLIESDMKTPLLTIGNMEELKQLRKLNQADRKADEAGRAKEKLTKEVRPMISNDASSSDERVGRDNHHKSKGKNPVRKTKRSSSRGVVKSNGDSEAVARPPKRKSKEYVEISSDEEDDTVVPPKKKRHGKQDYNNNCLDIDRL
jgi:hypothetical protein